MKIYAALRTLVQGAARLIVIILRGVFSFIRAVFRTIGRNLPFILSILFFASLFIWHRLFGVGIHNAVYGTEPKNTTHAQTHVSADSTEEALALFGSSLPLQGLQTRDDPINWEHYELELHQAADDPFSDPANWKSFYSCVAYTAPGAQYELRICFDPDDTRLSDFRASAAGLGLQTGQLGEKDISYAVQYGEDASPDILIACVPYEKASVLYCFTAGTADYADSVEDGLAFLAAWHSLNKEHPALG